LLFKLIINDDQEIKKKTSVRKETEINILNIPAQC
jgi:hypothetical protein